MTAQIIMTNSFLKKLLGLAVFGAAMLALVLVLNVGGWRARVLARLLEVNNGPVVVPPPPGFQPQVPHGFRVNVFARDFEHPRWLATAPNGDIFVAESYPGKITVLQDPNRRGQAEARFTFAEKLRQPFGIAFHGPYVYIGDTDEVLRIRYDPKTSRALGGREHILDLPGGGYNQHWTRTVAFSPDGLELFVSVGSKSNVGIESDPRRAAITVSDPEGKNAHIYASGLRNAVGIAFNPQSGQLWAAVNERDALGDDVAADYFTHVVDSGFYGWPYSFLGAHVDNRVSPRPDLVAKALVPDLLLGAHVAPLEFIFYEAHQFPSPYLHGAFIAEHGSWNRRERVGYGVVFVPFKDGKPSGEAAPFFTGFVPNSGAREVYGRMVGVTVAADGALLISDDGGRLIWRVWYSGG